MRIALIFLKLENQIIYASQLRPPLGLMYLKSALQSYGNDVEIIDQRVADFSYASFLEKITSSDYDIVGFHVNSVNGSTTLDYVGNLRNDLPDTMIIAGGPGAVEYRKILQKGCDYVFHGECEERLAEFVRRIRESRDPGDLDGISFKDSAGEIMHRPPLSVPDLNAISMPYWDNDLISTYGDNLIPTLKRPTATIMASRGCIFNCAFCTTPSMKCYRVREVEDVIDEIKYLKKRFGIKYITFIDDFFGGKPGWIYDFCTRMIEENLRVNWFCLLHPLSFKEDRKNIFHIMKQAGCDCAAFGAQSSSSDILKNISRNESEPAELAKALQICRETGIITIATYIFGLPGESYRSISNNVRYALKYRPDFADFHEYLTLPGSKLALKDSSDFHAFTHSEILALCRKAMIRFYMDPFTIWNFVTRVLFRNVNYLKHLTILFKEYLQLFFHKLSYISGR